MLRSSELMRIMTMLGLLAVLGMLMIRARDPSMWRFFSEEGQQAQHAADDELAAAEPEKDSPVPPGEGQGVRGTGNEPSAGDSKQEPGKTASANPAKTDKTEKPAAKPTSDGQSTGKSPHPGPLPKGEGDRAAGAAPKGEGEKTKKPPAETVLPGPTDEDPEQRAEAANESQAVADGTLGVQPEDMQLYWRMFLWTEHQSMAEMKRRAKKDLVFNEFAQSPEKYRGKLVRLDLNVRRVLGYEVTDGPPEIKKVYEVWGFTEESKAWLYCVLTSELPEGMPVGPEVYERVSFVGYFFKMQGYREAGAKPHAPALKAPLLIGRMTRYPSITERQTKDDSWWTWTVGGTALVLIVGFGVYRMVMGRFSARRRRLERGREVVPVRQWLAEDFPPDGFPAASEPWPGLTVEPPDATPDPDSILNVSRPSSNGHSDPGNRVPE